MSVDNDNQMDVDDNASLDNSLGEATTDQKYVNMRVVDGIVTGPQHCARPSCYEALASYRGESYCEKHFSELGHLCRVVDCSERVFQKTKACQAHQANWKRFQNSRRQHKTASDIRRIIQRPGERMPWQDDPEQPANPHDGPDPAATVAKNYFSPSKYYCVETLCAPCGVVIAWALFRKSESPTNIMQFLNSVYPTPETRPSFICIDKACILLKTVANHYSDWMDTTRFIVDTYHYKNHSKTDELCQKFCNPAPEDGGSPNLVVLDQDSNGRPVWKRAFNTQV
jgi:hypothetical protein